MYYAGSLTGEGSALLRRFKIGATTVAGSIVIKQTSFLGTITPATTTAAADAFGLCMEAGTYTTTQGTGADTANVEVYTVYNPFAIFHAPIHGGTNANNITSALDITSQASGVANATNISDANLPSDSMAGGWAYGLTGANKSQTRVITSFQSATSANVEIPFDVNFAVSNFFLVFGGGPGVAKLEFGSNITTALQYYPTATGANVRILEVIVDDHDPSAPTAKYAFVLSDHAFNPESA